MDEIALERAAELCRGALHARTPSPSPASLRYGRAYHSAAYRVLFTLLCGAWLALAFVEPPFRSPNAGFPLAAVRALDAMFLFFALVDALLLQRGAFGGAAFWGRGWVRVKLCALFALAVNLLVVIGFDAFQGGRPAVYAARVLRPLLLVERHRTLRRLGSQVWRAVPAALTVGALLLAQLLFFSVLGVVLFNGVDGVNCSRARGTPTPPLGCSAFVSRTAGGTAAPFPSACKLFFSTLGEATIHLFALSTAANFPMVALPAVACNVANALFFVAFSGASIFGVGSLMLAVAAAGAGEVGGEEAVAKQGRALAGARAAFAALLAASRAPADAPRAPLPAVHRLLAALRPDAPPRALPLLAAAASCCGEGGAEEGGGGGLTREQFSALLLVFVPLRIGEKPPRPSLAVNGGAPQAPPGDGARPSGRLAWLCRCCGGGDVHEQGPAPLDADAAEMQDADFLDGDEVGGGGTITAPPPAPRAGPVVVKNPLAAAAAGGEGGDSAAPAAAAAAAEAAVGTAAAPPAAVVAVAVGAAEGVASWGAGAPRPPAPRAAPLCSRLREAMLAAFASVPLASPPLDGSAGPLRARAARLINSPYATILFDGAIVVNTAVELYRLSTEVEGAPATPTVAALINAQRAMLAVFTLEFALKLGVFGPLAYLRAGWGHKLDALILAASLGAGFAEAAGRFDPTLTLLIQLFRALRLGRYAQKLRLGVARRTGIKILPGFGPTVTAGVDSAPLLARWLVITACVAYAFAVAGGDAFAGALGNVASLRSSWGTTLPPRVTFSTLGRSLLAVYTLLLNNTWPVLMEGTVAGTGTLWARAYFVVFMLLTRGLLLPVIAGSVVAAYGALWRARAEAEGAHGRRAVGAVDWRRAVAAAAAGGVAWGGLALSKNRHWEDGVTEVWRHRVREAFPELAAWEGGSGSTAQPQPRQAWAQ
jgi:hypothetical protein